MKIEIYFDDGRISKNYIELEKGVKEQRAIDDVAQRLFNQISQGGFISIPVNGGYFMVNSNKIGRLKIIPDEEEKQNADV